MIKNTPWISAEILIHKEHRQHLKTSGEPARFARISGFHTLTHVLQGIEHWHERRKMFITFAPDFLHRLSTQPPEWNLQNISGCDDLLMCTASANILKFLLSLHESVYDSQWVYMMR